MPRAMFAYTKAILKKVSFDSELFYIEVQKAIQHLLPYEFYGAPYNSRNCSVNVFNNLNL